MTLVDVDVVPPPFFCPIPAAVHPAVGEIEAVAIEWLDRVHLHRTDRERDRLLGTHSAEFYARFAPDGVPTHILTAALWVYWGFAFDDARCDSGPYSMDPSAFLALSGMVQRAMEGTVRPAEPYAAALHDIAARMRTQVTATVFRRFVEAHRHWLHCVAWQIGNCAAGRMPTVQEYLTMRAGSAGGPPTVELLEIANGIEVPSREMDSPAVRALTEMTQLIASLDNDLHSFRKELVENQTAHNILSVLRGHDGLSPAAALDAAVSIRDRAMIRFLELRDQVRATASAELRTYLAGLGHAIRGNIDWAGNVPRYLSGGPLRVEISEEPHDTNPDPLPYPAVSWWWERLAG
ncbi:terpene synthase family protein [Actinophytocola glycyrrhizae]|uniref:Terpene synthase n=1 Tax=Actinophytocola glycyrrhizae TaxID=2044873 RepID=A0ABV9RWW6_9PSEU